MMVVPCDFLAYILGNNQSVLISSSKPFSVLKKKAYHFVHEGVVSDELRSAYVITHDNPADLLTKPIGRGEKQTKLTGMILYHL